MSSELQWLRLSLKSRLPQRLHERRRQRLAPCRCRTLSFPTFDDDEIAQEAAQPVSILHDVELHVKIELGRTHMYVEDVLQLSEGSVVELDRLAGDPVDVYVNNRLVARGEVLVLNDNFCVRVSEIVSAAADARLVG